ncbi:GPW/gp25 family protein [Anaerotruncus colihominis]|jgi:hypothetical protein|uniref:Lysozyme n=2 Tax=Anaerotruncus colihominis TaxID=169435 RepID=B0P624_9FIRM|nr:GPW/gp25 family protein [Anaerotruncus colihominis]EDS13181.1 putative lysozyme [Anaerotruncus colihominis DSM 17241]MCQ4735152.1 GPW/gp25 family protein [Anaerotruncus colihominis]RGE66694.1 hypothetical protein DXC40_13035 [Anaerotruncus colihominis]UWN75750.1 GPW/gp25 family protein [Anaerotruncus colihominis]
MTYTISAADLRNIRLNQTDALNSVIQNIAIILSTAKGSVPLHRDFGIAMDALDRPVSVAEVMMRADIREAIERWEPRAAVVDIAFSGDASEPGKLIPTVEVEINNG